VILILQKEYMEDIKRKKSLIKKLKFWSKTKDFNLSYLKNSTFLNIIDDHLFEKEMSKFRINSNAWMIDLKMLQHLLLNLNLNLLKRKKNNLKTMIENLKSSYYINKNSYEKSNKKMMKNFQLSNKKSQSEKNFYIIFSCKNM